MKAFRAGVRGELARGIVCVAATEPAFDFASDRG
jgi:hypothetical protein